MSIPNGLKVVYDFNQLYSLIKKTQKYRTGSRPTSPAHAPKPKQFELKINKNTNNLVQSPTTHSHNNRISHPSNKAFNTRTKIKPNAGAKAFKDNNLSHFKLNLEDSVFNFSSFCVKPNCLDGIKPLTETISNKSIVLVSTTSKENSANKIVFNMNTVHSTLNSASKKKEFKTFHSNNGATSNNSYASEQTTPSRHKFSLNKSRDSPTMHYTRLNIPLPSKLTTIYYKYLEKLRYGNNAKQLKKNTGDEATVLPEDID